MIDALARLRSPITSYVGIGCGNGCSRRLYIPGTGLARDYTIKALF